MARLADNSFVVAAAIKKATMNAMPPNHANTNVRSLLPGGGAEIPTMK
jgi:hypothetical protein